MKLLLIADAEGCALYDIEKNNSKEAMCKELSALLRKVEDLDIEITVIDAHGDGHNIDSLINCFPEVTFVHHLWSLHDYDYDAAILIGFHAKAQEKSKNAHTIRPEIKNLSLGSVSVGEVTLLINWLSYYSIPVVFISGEKELCKEIEGLRIPYYLYEMGGGESKIKRMCDQAFVALGQNSYIQYYQNDPVQIYFWEHVYHDFIPSCIGKDMTDYIVFSNTMIFMELLPVLSELINAAHSMQIVCLNRLRYLKKYETDQLNRLQDLMGNLFVYDKAKLSSQAYQNILRASYEKTY